MLSVDYMISMLWNDQKILGYFDINSVKEAAIFEKFVWTPQIL